MFFFSSRRRHTRFDCDWSSDVCSSDLSARAGRWTRLAASMALTPGSTLGSYEILAPLGAGGMGEVYRARDPRLGRAVAIKVLPAAVSADADRLARFEREARAVAARNHPHIVT